MTEQNVVTTTQEKSLYPTEYIDLPSEGKLYTPDNPLSSGRIELKYPTAREEDILTSRNLIQKGLVIDAFIKSLVIDEKINLDTILLGDKNAIVVASRILAYGKDYPVKIECPKCSVTTEQTLDISEMGTKEVNLSAFEPGVNLFEIALPASKSTVKFKLLTQADEKDIDAELKTMKKLLKGKDAEITTRLRHAIVSVNGDTDRMKIKLFVDSLPSIDSLAFRTKLAELTPDMDMQFDFECTECGYTERMAIPLTVQFFWPSGRV